MADMQGFCISSFSVTFGGRRERPGSLFSKFGGRDAESRDGTPDPPGMRNLLPVATVYHGPSGLQLKSFEIPHGQELITGSRALERSIWAETLASLSEIALRTGNRRNRNLSVWSLFVRDRGRNTATCTFGWNAPISRRGSQVVLCSRWRHDQAVRPPESQAHTKMRSPLTSPSCCSTAMNPRGSDASLCSLGAGISARPHSPRRPYLRSVPPDAPQRGGDFSSSWRL